MTNNGNIIDFPLRFLTVDAAAWRLKISRNTIRTWIRHKQIETAVFDGAILLPAAVVDELEGLFEGIRRKPQS